uniref:tripartite tricarboxylate transporter permease n=1 Tax=Pigmentiphaga sp. TaxID=1977564 RepID=UPI0025D07A35
IPRPYLYAGILIFAMVGIWGVATSWADMAMMFGIGLLGYIMRVYDFPIAPVLIGLILGPMAETQLRRALAVGEGNPLILVSTPTSATLLTLAAAALVLPLLLRRLKRNA